MQEGGILLEVLPHGRDGIGGGAGADVALVGDDHGDHHLLVALRLASVADEPIVARLSGAIPHGAGFAADLQSRYAKAQLRDYDGNPSRLTEMDALVAYLQVLGTLVDVNSAAAQEDLATEKGR